MSTPRPIHHPSRPIRTEPHESEPVRSFTDDPSPLLDEEDDFHNKLSQSRRVSSGGGSFWRTSDGPAFSSATIPNNNNHNHSKITTTTSTGELKQMPGGVNKSSSGVLIPTKDDYQTQKSDSVASKNSIESMHNAALPIRRADSDRSSTGGSSANNNNINSNNNNINSSNNKDSKKNLKKQRNADRKLKHEFLEGRVDMPRIEDEKEFNDNNNVMMVVPPVGGFADMAHGSSLDRSSSDQSTGSLLYGKTPNSGALLGKSSSLIFPTGVETNAHDGDNEVDNAKRRKINLLLDQCEAVRFPFRKKLALEKLGITAADIPLNYLCGTPLGNALYKLSLVGNRLGSVPAKLVQSLPTLKHLDLSQCELHQLPPNWNLPALKKLNLSHNRLRDFPDESILDGLPELTELNMYGNKVAAVVIPHDKEVLGKLEVLNLGYNDLAYLPDELDQLRNLKSLKLMNNFLEKVPMRVCEMDLKSIDVSFNPVIQPPLETCERGIFSMRRYYHCLRLEEQSKNKAMEEAQKKAGRQKKKKGYACFLQNISISKSASPHGSKHADVATRGKSLALPTSPSTSVAQPKQSLSTSSPTVPVHDVIVDTRKDMNGFESFDDTVDTNLNDVTKMEEVVDPGKTVNDTLKVIFVGMAMVGKTSMIKRLIEGRNAVIPTHVERTVGVDIYSWDPKKDTRFEHIDSRIELQDKELAETCGDVDVKFSCFDFAGQHVYHATHELFFSSRALYVLVWDMGATNRATLKRKPSVSDETGAFKLYSDSDEEEEGDDFADEEERRRADRALEHDIDEKVQFWIDCIQSSAPGAAILPVASFNDYFDSVGGDAEARRRCCILKNRLLKHEERRVEGLRRRLQVYIDQNKPDDPVAHRLRKLLCSYTRPRLIFGDGDESVVRVSGTQYTGFEKLTEKIIDIATGRDKVNSRYAVFHGHVGALIPRMYLEVREAVRTLRGKFKVVEWGYFLNQLKERGLTNDDYISEALHFLTNIGELSYFGGVSSNNRRESTRGSRNSQASQDGAAPGPCGPPDCDDGTIGSGWEDFDDDDIDDDHGVLSMDETSITAPSTEDGSLTTVEDYMTSGLSQFVFLNPRWLVAAIACILRHDLDNEIKETRRQLSPGSATKPIMDRKTSFEDAQMNCPVITAEDACLLWQAKKITKKAAERAQQYSNNMTMSPFEFLQLLLVRFGVFVPIDAGIQRALLAGKEYADIMEGTDSMVVDVKKPVTPTEIIVERSSEAALKAKFFFLPSLLGPGEPSEAWTYKNTESWKTTLCHSVLFPDGVPPGLMERLTANVLSAVYAVCNQTDTNSAGYVANDVATYEGRLTIREVLCWRTAFFIRLGTVVPASDGNQKDQRESVVEIFATLADRDSRLCVGSDYMGVGMRRLIICGRGPEGDGGRKIWKGGYLLACKCVRRVMEGYGGLEFEEHGFCPECLAKRSINEASSWETTAIRTAVKNSEAKIRCQHGHRVDTRCVAGPVDHLLKLKFGSQDADPDPVVPVRSLLGAVVVVGLWDGKTRKVVRVGSGFVVDRRRGLIVTASHTLMNIWGDRNYPFGENYYGLRQGKVVIGVIPKENESESSHGRDQAVFRYFAKIVAKDPSMEKGECHIDACVLRITTRLEKDVGGDGEGCGDQPEKLLLGNEQAFKDEKLQALKLCENVELEEQVRILGYNQGGEGLLGPGENLNRFVDFARGYVCKKFASGEQEETSKNSLRDRFKPHEEIAVICPTIGGHSGGPCVNQQGQVIGILSRADPAETQRCYISPTSEWKPLVKMAKNIM